MKKTIFVFSFAIASLSLFSQQSAGYTDKQSGYETNKFWDNWFLNVGGGPAFYWDGGPSNRESFIKGITWGATASVGKWFTPLWGGRLNIQGGILHTYNKHGVPLLNEEPKHKVATDGYATVHVDGLFNFSNWVAGYKPNRTYNLIPYVGVGIGANEWPWNGDWWNFNKSFVPVVGLLNTFKLGKKLDFTVDISGQAVQSKWNSARFGQNSEVAYANKSFDRQDWDGIVSVMFGLNFKLSKKQTFNRAEICVQDDLDTPLVEDLTGKVRALIAENDSLRQQLAQKPVVEQQQPEKTVKANVTKVIAVPFTINKYLVETAKQKSIINEAVTFLKENPNTNAKVVGYADKGTGTVTI
ncbi:MAG: hypothetical protein LBT29_03315, partial [Flavobacteriaceae bacterium]|nr:hypothetical protein [Flavobacteriaceae bacterium]